MSIMKKTTVLCICLLAMLALPLFAGDMFATTDDGRMVVLHDGGTYTPFEEITYDKMTGFEVKDGPKSGFLNTPWDNVRLIKLGNHLESNGFGPGIYTTGEYYLLSFSVKSALSSDMDISGWSVPQLTLTDGSVLSGFDSSYREEIESRSYSYYSRKDAKKSCTYTIVFEVPAGKSVKSVDVKTSSAASYTSLSLGKEKQF